MCRTPLYPNVAETIHLDKGEAWQASQRTHLRQHATLYPRITYCPPGQKSPAKLPGPSDKKASFAMQPNATNVRFESTEELLSFQAI